LKPLKNVSTYWLSIIGQDSQFSMESRIFNAVCIFAVLTASINAIINICLGLLFYGLIMVPLIGILFLCYYLSRYKNKLSWGVSIAAVAFNLLCGGTYFEAAGSNGVNLFTFILIVYLLTLVCSTKQTLIFIPLNILLIAGLLFVEYHYPELVKPLYNSEKVRLLDLTQTLLEIMFMFIVITLFIKRSYNREKQLAETRLIALEESNETKHKLFSIVAHDLKAPLASVENYLELLNEIDLNSEEKLTIEKNLLASTRQTSAMLHNILSWSKDQMEGPNTNLKILDLHQVLHHTINFQNSLAREKGIELLYEPTTALAIADPDMLQLIIRNLLNNAIKFSTPGGKITFSIEEQEKHCLIKVSDEGIGISKSKRQNIFTLKSAGTYGTNNEKGVGLGLKLAKSYTELQNGRIWFESTEGEGTTFYLSLPKGTN
jgi:two-component system sensor histidine kinase/response regulator